MPHNEHIRYVPEPAAIGTRGVVWSGLGALLLVAGAIAGLYATYTHAVPVKAPPAPRSFPQPRVDTQDTEKLQSLGAEQSKELETWRWANDQHTLAQIPIERAMQLLAQKGASAYDPLPPPTAQQP
jgi:hypothetical protein